MKIDPRQCANYCDHDPCWCGARRDQAPDPAIAAKNQQWLEARRLARANRVVAFHHGGGKRHGKAK